MSCGRGAQIAQVDRCKRRCSCTGMGLLNIANPPIDPPKLPREVALEVATVARVPPEERDQFCDLLQVSVQSVWTLNRGATEPSQALIDAAQGSRTLLRGFGSLNKQDSEWVESVRASNPWYGKKVGCRFRFGPQCTVSAPASAIGRGTCPTSRAN